MARLTRRLLSALRLARVTTSLAAVADVWFVILWTRATPAHEPGTEALTELPLTAALIGGAAAAVGLYAFGTSLNDLVDQSRDRALGRDRPLPAGSLAPEHAAFGVILALLLAVFGASTFGTRAVQLTLLLALAILAFNAVGKFLPAIGFLMLALVYAGHMLVPNWKLQFLWPVWLVMTHALAVAGLTHWVSRKSPPVSRRALTFAVLGWLGASAILVWVGTRRLGRDAAGKPTDPAATDAAAPGDGLTQGARPAARANQADNSPAIEPIAPPGSTGATPPADIIDPAHASRAPGEGLDAFLPSLPPLWPDWVPPTAAIGPLLLAAVYALAAYRRINALGFGPRTAEKLSRYGALWMALYGAAWLLGAGHIPEAAILLALAAAGLIGMTVLREAYGMIEYPLAYRR